MKQRFSSRATLARTVRHLQPSYVKIEKHARVFRERSMLNAGQLRMHQDQDLRLLLTHAASNVPYWRNIFREYEFRADEVSLATLPIMEKQDLQLHFESMKSDDLNTREWYVNRSGGSTGEPVTFIQDKDYFYSAEGRKQVFFEQMGWHAGAPFIRLWGSERDIVEAGGGWWRGAKNYIHNRTVLNAFRMTPQSMFAYIDLLNERGPACVHAYVNAAYELALFSENMGRPILPQSAVVCTSGTLLPFMRDVIARVFSCDVFDQYGSREVSVIASNCSNRDGLHVAMETNIVEIVDQNGMGCEPGIEGDILVTSLTNYAMPLIRYRIGDRGVVQTTDTCACGSSLERLARVGGRATDCFRRRDGGIVPAEYFIHFLGVVLNKGLIKKVQLIQHSFEEVSLKIVALDKKPSRDDLVSIVEAIKHVMDTGCQVAIDIVDDIPVGSSGKYHYTLCELDPVSLE